MDELFKSNLNVLTRFIKLNKYAKILLSLIITFNRNFRFQLHTVIEVTTYVQRFFFYICDLNLNLSIFRSFKIICNSVFFCINVLSGQIIVKYVFHTVDESMSHASIQLKFLLFQGGINALHT